MSAARGRRHPIMKFPIVIRLSHSSIWTLGFVFIFTSFAASALIGLLLTITTRTPMAFDEAFRFAISNSWNPGDLLQRPNESTWFYAVAAADAVLGVLLPTFLLGAFVFKLLQHDPLVWRTTFSVEKDINGFPILRFRFYNGTRSPIVRVRVEVYARVRITGNPGTLRNYRLMVSLRDGSEAPSEFWAFGRPGVPYVVSAPLGGPMTVDQMTQSKLIFLDAYGDPTDRELVSFLLIADGTILDTGHSFVSTNEFSASKDILFGHYQEIGADYKRNPRRWTGWENFDGSSDMYVFGYASLTSRASMSSTLGHDVNPSHIVPAQLSGWRREWNVGSDNESHPEREILNDDGSIFRGVVAVMGVEQGRPEDRCNGAAFVVNTEDLAKLDRRERNYRRVDVTQAISFKGMPHGCVVFTYVPLTKAVERLDRARQDRRPVAVRAQYVEQIEEGFAQLGAGELDDYRRTTPRVIYDVRPLTFRYNDLEVPDADDSTHQVRSDGLSTPAPRSAD
jgi:hypothetical protein